MNIVCVKCGAGAAYDLPALADQSVLVCAACGTGLRVSLQPFVVPSVASASGPASAEGHAASGQVVVAVEGEATREFIRELLTGGGFAVVDASTGREVLQRITERPPAVAIVDVGLTDMLGFQVCEAIRAQPQWAGVKILLVAAIYNKDRYKRQPGNLYGADGFIERHRLEDELVGKVRMLCDKAPVDRTSTDRVDAPTTAKPIPTAPAVQPAIAEPRPAPPAAAEPAVKAIPTAPTPAAKSTLPPPSAADPRQEAALRLARIIVSDIALYNPKKVDEGVLNGTFFDILRQELDEGRRLYEERRPQDLADAANYFQQTLEQFIQTRRRLLQRNDPAAA